MTTLKTASITLQSVIYTVLGLIGVPLTIIVGILLLPIVIFVVVAFILFVIIRVVLSTNTQDS